MIPFIYREKSPNTQLQSYVKRYWRFRRKFGLGKSQTIFPDGHYELMWVRNGTLIVNGQPAPRLFIGGQTNEPITISADGTVEIWSVRFQPWGLMLLGDVHLTNRSSLTPATKVFDIPTYNELHTLFNTTPRKELFSTLNEYLLGKLSANQFIDPTIQAAASHMITRNGDIKIKDLANYCQLSQRQLERIMAKATGKSPHDITSSLRFEHARSILSRDPAVSMATLAYECGYTDQSHLHKEFQRYTNLTPMEYSKVFGETYSHLYKR